MSRWTKEPWHETAHGLQFVELRGHDYDRAAACVNALSGVPDPGALLGEVRATVSAMVQALRQIADGPGLIAQHGDALEAGLALLQRLPAPGPDGGGA